MLSFSYRSNFYPKMCLAPRFSISSTANLRVNQAPNETSKIGRRSQSDC